MVSTFYFRRAVQRVVAFVDRKRKLEIIDSDLTSGDDEQVVTAIYR
jgi:hypothetical protein